MVYIIKKGNLSIATYLAASHSDVAKAVPTLYGISAKIPVVEMDICGNSLLHLAVEHPDLVRNLLASDAGYYTSGGEDYSNQPFQN